MFQFNLSTSKKHAFFKSRYMYDINRSILSLLQKAVGPRETSQTSLPRGPTSGTYQWDHEKTTKLAVTSA